MQYSVGALCICGQINYQNSGAENVWANLRRALSPMCNFGAVQHISLSTPFACRLSAAIHFLSAMRVFLTSIIYKSRAHASEKEKGSESGKKLSWKVKNKRQTGVSERVSEKFVFHLCVVDVAVDLFSSASTSRSITFGFGRFVFTRRPISQK